MTEITVYETGKQVSIPSSWDEMTAEQVQGIFRLFDDCLKRNTVVLEFSVRVLYLLLDIKPSRRRMLPWRRERISENVYRLCDRCLGFLFEKEDTGGGAKLTYASVVNSLPEVRGTFYGRPLVGPADLLQDLSFGEFRHAAAALNAFFKSHDVGDLDECIAHLYRRRTRRPNRCGRYVKEVDNASFAKDVKRAARMKNWQKNLIMMWFAACLHHLQNNTVIINGESVDMGLLFSSDSKTTSGVAYSWNDLLVQIARDGSIGCMERVDQEPLFSIFGLMWSNYKENKRYENRTKTAEGK